MLLRCDEFAAVKLVERIELRGTQPIDLASGMAASMRSTMPSLL